MAATCGNCGFTMEGWRGGLCGQCGHDTPFEFGTLILNSAATARSLHLRLDAILGMRALEELVGEDARYAAPAQFRLLRSQEQQGWTVEHCASATNATFVNGLALGSRAVRLEDGMVVSLAGGRLPLRVSLADGETP